MATKPNGTRFLTGEAAYLAALPLAPTPQGGLDNSFTGVTVGPPKKKRARNRRAEMDNPMIDPLLPDDEGEQEPNGADDLEESDKGTEAPAPDEDFKGMGPWLTKSGQVLFLVVDELVRRQELLALNHLAVDRHFSLIKQGYAFSTLTKDQNRSTYRCELPAGTSSNMIQAVPNKTWDLCNKATETVLVDFAQPNVTPIDNSQKARAAAKVAQRVLDQNSGEAGSNDVRLFFEALDRALVCSSSYIERWTDPVGGGYIPLQILAHPEATDPANPLVGPDGMPTTDPVLRYITAPDGGKFTDDPTQAAPEWQPKIRASIWGREHVRVFPETCPVDDAEKIILQGYCTLAEAKRRWPKIADMDQAQLNTLLDWTPPRFLDLLPPFLQARWNFASTMEKEKQGSSDERLLFYYHLYAKASPENKRGVDLVLSGADEGTILNRDVLAAIVPSTKKPDVKEVRCLDIPITQLTPRADPDGRDPSGLSYLWLFSGAVEFDAALMTAFLEMVALWVHPDSYQPSTSPVQAAQVRNSRLTGEPIPILRPEDKPVYGNQPVLPNSFWQSIEHNASAIESIASMTKPLTGSDRQPEVSGKARQIAVQQAMVGLSRMQYPVNAARARDARITLQLTMRDVTTEQTVRFMGKGGTWEAQTWTGVDFAMVGGVEIKFGTGTMLAPEAKVNYLGNLQTAGLISPEVARDAARTAYAPALGITDSPHEQYVERSIKAWLAGPPEGWLEQWKQHKQALAEWEAQAKQQQQQQLQQEQMQEQQAGQQQMQQMQQMQAQEQQAQQGRDQQEQQARDQKLQQDGMAHQQQLRQRDEEHQQKLRQQAEQQAARPPAPTRPK